MNRLPARCVKLAIAAVLVAVAGCGRPPADVTGSVSYRGRPVVYGTVSIIAADQMTYYATIQTDGTFAVPGIPAGPARLGVYSPDPYFEPPIPPAMKARYAEAQRAAGGPVLPKPPKGQWVRLPPKYTDPVSSGLTAEVSAPATTIDLRLD